MQTLTSSLFDAALQASEITKERVISTERTARVCAVRSIIAKILHEQLFSLTDIGEILGGRTHSTVLNMLKAYKSDHTMSAGFRSIDAQIRKLFTNQLNTKQ